MVFVSKEIISRLRLPEPLEHLVLGNVRILSNGMFVVHNDPPRLLAGMGGTQYICATNRMAEAFRTQADRLALLKDPPRCMIFRSFPA